MTDIDHFVRVDFTRFKAFETFTLHLRPFNILVGPNNSGKSTILAAFRILAAAMRRAGTRRAETIHGPRGKTPGYAVDLTAISVAEENIFYNYDESEPATVRFTLSNRNELLLYFPERGICNLTADADGQIVLSPSTFRSRFNCPIGFVPILGPVEHNEMLYSKEAARLALFNYRAARNFRNIWYHYPENFDAFRSALTQTWPGMDIERPTVDLSHEKPRLYMFCPEERIPREIFWSGFGFQVWCQMLTHIIQSDGTSLFLIDEPDIYLHSDLQRQLLGLLRNMGADIIIATHSTEIITEAETDDIILVSKARKTARRIRNPSQLEEVFKILGSNLNPILTQLAKTRKAIFVEGKDFQIIGKFARKLRISVVETRREFAVVPIEGFNPDRIRSLKNGMETTLGAKVLAAAILDRDYRSDEECKSIIKQCEVFCDYVTIHTRKEVENFLLVPDAINRAASAKVIDHNKRTGGIAHYTLDAGKILDEFAMQKKSYVIAQYLAFRRQFERGNTPHLGEATIAKAVLDEFEGYWKDPNARLVLIPGKDALSNFNQRLQNEYAVSVTATAVVDAMKVDEVPTEMRRVIEGIAKFVSSRPA